MANLRCAHLTIGTIPSVSAFLLPHAIAQIRSKYPAVDIRLTEGTSETVTAEVAARRCDLGIVQLPVNGAVARYHTLLREPFVLLWFKQVWALPFFRNWPPPAARRAALSCK